MFGEFRTSAIQTDPKVALKKEAQQLVTSLVTESFASEMSLFLIENYLKISKEQIEEWEENPEGNEISVKFSTTGMVNEELRGAYQQVPNVIFREILPYSLSPLGLR